MSKQDLSSPKAKRKARERSLRRETIIGVAKDIFIEHGYDATMVEKVATEAGYTKMTLYNYFESKDDLFIAVVARVYEELFQIMDTYLKQSDVSNDLRSMGDAYLKFYTTFPEDALLFESSRLGVVISYIKQKEANNEKLTESEHEFREQLRLIEDLMTSTINETLKKSGIAGKVDPFSVVMVLSTFAQAIRELVSRGRNAEDPEKKTKEYLSIFFTIIDQGLKHFDE